MKRQLAILASILIVAGGVFGYMYAEKDEEAQSARAELDTLESNLRDLPNDFTEVNAALEEVGGGLAILNPISLEQAYQLVQQNRDNPDFININVRNPKNLPRAILRG